MQNDHEPTPVDIRQPPRSATELDVVAIGNALVDVLATATDEDVQKLGLVKGTMAVVDLERSEAIYATMGPTVAASGGSAANTVAGVAALGGRAAFLGRVADDELGRTFTHDIRSIGVAFEPRPTPAKSGESVTGHCLVLVTDDAERTMATHLGVASDFASVDLHAGQLSSTQVAYFEGYLWDQEAAKSAMREAMDLAHANDAAVALTLSDPFCVQSHQDEFLELLNGDLDILLANEEEVMLLFGTTDFDAAVSAVEETGLLAALTEGRGRVCGRHGQWPRVSARCTGGQGGGHHRRGRPVRRRLPVRDHQWPLTGRERQARSRLRGRGDRPCRGPYPGRLAGAGRCRRAVSVSRWRD